MNLTDFWLFLGRAFEWFFINIMENLQMIPNKFFFFTGWVLFFIWMYMMHNFNKEAKEKGTLK